MRKVKILRWHDNDGKCWWEIIKLDLKYPNHDGDGDEDNDDDDDDNDLGQQKALQTVKYNPALQMTIKLRPSAGLSAWQCPLQDNFIQEMGHMILRDCKAVTQQ